MLLGKDLEKNESALNEGFIEHKMLSERYVVLKSKVFNDAESGT